MGQMLVHTTFRLKLHYIFLYYDIGYFLFNVFPNDPQPCVPFPLSLHTVLFNALSMVIPRSLFGIILATSAFSIAFPYIWNFLFSPPPLPPPPPNPSLPVDLCCTA